MMSENVDYVGEVEEQNDSEEDVLSSELSVSAELSTSEDGPQAIDEHQDPSNFHIQNLDHEVGVLKGENSTLKEEVDEKEDLKLRFKMLEIKNESNENMKNVLRQMTLRLNIQNLELQKQNELAQQRNEILSEEIVSKRNDNEEFKDRLESFMISYKLVEKQREEMTRRKEEAEAETEKLKEEKQVIENEKETLEKEVKEKQEEVEDEKSSKTYLAKVCIEKNIYIDALEREIELKKKEYEEQLKRIREKSDKETIYYERRIRSLRNESREEEWKLQQQINELQVSIFEVQNNARKEKMDLKWKLEMKETEIQRGMKVLETMKSQLEKATLEKLKTSQKLRKAQNQRTRQDDSVRKEFKGNSLGILGSLFNVVGMK